MFPRWRIVVFCCLMEIFSSKVLIIISFIHFTLVLTPSIASSPIKLIFHGSRISYSTEKDFFKCYGILGKLKLKVRYSMKLSLNQESSFSALTKLKNHHMCCVFCTNSAKNTLSVIIRLVTVVNPVSRTSSYQSVGRGFEPRLKHEIFLQNEWGGKYSGA